MGLLSKILNFFLPVAKAEEVLRAEEVEVKETRDMSDVVLLPAPNSYIDGQYVGTRYETYHNGKLIAYYDNRILEEEKRLKIQEIKAIAEERILAVAPIYKQLNAANGLLDGTEKTEILNHISLCRAFSETKETEITDSEDLDTLDTVKTIETIEEYDTRIGIRS